MGMGVISVLVYFLISFFEGKKNGAREVLRTDKILLKIG